MTIYIVVKDTYDGFMVESTWSTKELALAACWYHAHESGHKTIVGYHILERELDKAHKLNPFISDGDM